METELKQFINTLNKKLNPYKKGIEFYKTVTEDKEKYFYFVFFIYQDSYKIDYYIKNGFKLKELENINLNYSVIDYDFIYYELDSITDYYNEFIIEVSETGLKQLIGGKLWK